MNGTQLNPINKKFLFLSFVVFFVGFVFYHWLEISTGWDVVSGDRGDSRLVPFLLEHWYWVFKGRNSALSPPIFYPTAETLGYSHSLVGYLPLYLPFRWLGVDGWHSFQWALGLTDFLNYGTALGLFLFGFSINQNLSIFFAVFLTFNSAKFNQTNHLQLQPLFLIILSAAFFVHGIRKINKIPPQWIWICFSISFLLMDLQLLTDVYHAWFFIFWFLLWILAALFRKSVRVWVGIHFRELVRLLGGALIVGAIGFYPFLRIYLPVKKMFGGWGFGVASTMVPRWNSFFWMGEGNWLWGKLPISGGLPYPWEHKIGLGFGIIFLLIWVISQVKKLSDQARIFLDSFLLFLFLGIYYSDNFVPWKWVYALVPGAEGLRAVSRYMIILILPLCIGLGLALSDLMKSWSRSKLRYLSLLFLFILVEQIGSNSGYSIAAEKKYLQSIVPLVPYRCETFYLVPKTNRTPVWEYQIDAMWIAHLKGIPTLNGYSGHFPPYWPLYDMRDKDYEKRVEVWTKSHQILGSVCRVETLN